MRLAALLILVPGIALGQIYKCPKPGGGFDFTDRPCAGAVESPGNAINVDARPSPDVERQKQAVQASQKKDEELQHQKLVAIPALELEAVGLMASGDPAKQAIGRQMATKAQEQKMAVDQLIRARAAQEETKRRYEDAIRELNR